MQTEHLKYLLAAIDYGSMNSAARALCCTQPTISSAIKSLESELGFPLISRSAAGVIPTEQGKTVLEDARLILAYIDSWKSQGSVDLEQQTVDIAVAGTTQRYKLVDSILRMRTAEPTMQVNINFSPNLGISCLFSKEKTYRIGVFHQIPRHIIEAKKYVQGHGMVLAQLLREEFAVFINAQDPLAKKEDLLLEDLRGKSVLLYQTTTDFPYIHELDDVSADYSLQMWSEDDIMRTVLLGGSVTIRPRSSAYSNPYVESGRIVVKSIVDRPMPVSICIAYPNKERISSAEKTLIRYLREDYPDFSVLA